MNPCHTVLTLFLIAGAAAADVHTATSPTRHNKAAHELVLHTATVEHLLRSVEDKESADRAAAGLRTEFDAMKKGLEALTSQGTATPADMQELARTMRRLTYMTQAYLPIIKRLDEVNAYGSEELMTVLHLYKQTAGNTPMQASEDAPVICAYTDWENALSDVLYHLRKVQSPQTAQSTLPALSQALQQLQVAHFGIQPFCGIPLSEPEQKEMAALLSRVEKQRTALHTEKERLRKARFYGVSELASLLNALEQAAE